VPGLLVVLDQAEVEAQLAHGAGHVGLLQEAVSGKRKEPED
jgi:hypothetical protein